MGGVVLAEDELIDLNDPNYPDMVFPESEPPFIEFTPPDPLLNPALFPDEDPPILPLPPSEFPVAPVDEDLGDLRVIQLNSDLFPPEEPRLIDLVIPPAIPLVPVDGDLSDGLQDVFQAGLTTIQGDLINEFSEMFPGPANTLDRIGNLAAQHPYASAGLGAGVLIVANVAAQAGLETYGDNLHMNSVTVPIGTYQNPNFTIPYLNLTFGFILSGSIQQNVGEPDWVRVNGVIRF